MLIWMTGNGKRKENKDKENFFVCLIVYTYINRKEFKENYFPSLIFQIHFSISFIVFWKKNIFKREDYNIASHIYKNLYIRFCTRPCYYFLLFFSKMTQGSIFTLQAQPCTNLIRKPLNHLDFYIRW